MKELKKNKKLTYLVVAIVAVILIGLISIRKPAIGYKLSTHETLKMLKDTSAYMRPMQVAALLQSKNSSQVVIDVRNSVDFEKNHLENTINIPVRELFGKANLKLLKEIQKSKQNIVLIGKNEQQAMGPWMMLCQTGFENVKVFTGIYQQLIQPITDSAILILPQNSEVPMIDTSAIKKLSTPVASIEVEKKVVKKNIAPVKKEVTSGGGC